MEPSAASRRSKVAFLVAVACASTAGMALVTALGKLVWDITHRELDLGWLGLVEFIPAALLVLVTGWVADHVDKRFLVSAAATLMAAVSGLLAWHASPRPDSASLIFLLVVGYGVGRAFIAPAERSMPADIVPIDELPRFTARFSATWQLSMIVGPALAGMLYAVDPRWPFVAVAVLFGVTAVSIQGVRLPRHNVPVAGDEPNRPTVRAALEGLHFIRRTPMVFGAIALDLFAVLFGGAVALLPVLAEKQLHTGAVGLGWLRAAAGIGAAIVTLRLAVRPVQRHVGRILLAVVACFGVFTVVLGLTRNYAVAFVAMAILSGADSVSVFIRATLVPLVTPPDRRGRVMAVENVFIGASNELGGFESGVVGQFLGAPTTVALGGVATIAIAGIWWWRFPALRDVDEFPTAVIVEVPA